MQKTSSISRGSLQAISRDHVSTSVFTDKRDCVSDTPFPVMHKRHVELLSD